MTTSLLLIALVTVCRVVPHEWNLVAVGAVALYAGARLPRRWAWAVPIAGMILSDLILDWGHAEPERAPFTVSRLTIYGTYAAIAFLGILARRAGGGRRRSRSGPWRWPGRACSSSRRISPSGPPGR